jgi:uncharacterized coiled-coil DUF342 family protein
VIKAQHQEIKELREQSQQQIDSMRAELEGARRKLDELRAKTDADDSDIAELAAFLTQHKPAAPPASRTEAA